MPTRVVEVGTSGADTPRLVESKSISPASRYVALSHCWGVVPKSQMLRTTRGNIEALKDSIVFTQLPRNFQDAITVTRGLGVRYIWIDSLCIIQDDVGDWYNESARMEQVFSEAYCTIGAGSAESSIQGFLSRGAPRPCVQLSIPDAGTLFVCPWIDDFHRDVEMGPLNSRGWVLQERALSRRTIFYTSTQAYWECGMGVHCETLTRLQK